MLWSITCCHEGATPANLRALYGIKRASSDKRLFALLQRGKGLEGFAWLDGHYLLLLDGTGYFSSQEVHCAQWGEKHHRHGTVTYYNIALQQFLHAAAGIAGLRKVSRSSAYKFVSKQSRWGKVGGNGIWSFPHDKQH